MKLAFRPPVRSGKIALKLLYTTAESGKWWKYSWENRERREQDERREHPKAPRKRQKGELFRHAENFLRERATESSGRALAGDGSSNTQFSRFNVKDQTAFFTAAVISSWVNIVRASAEEKVAKVVNIIRKNKWKRAEKFFARRGARRKEIGAEIKTLILNRAIES